MEWACRSGTTTRWFFGDDEKDLKNYVWMGPDSIHPVGKQKPSAFGLYDMHSPLWEFCADVWHTDIWDCPGDGSPWVKSDLLLRVARGGMRGFPSFQDGAADRYGFDRDSRSKIESFRPVLRPYSD
jgi:formylglycine-generating enzyme required for sulfatase activity